MRMIGRTAFNRDHHWPPTFHGRWWVPLGFVLVFSALVLLSNVAFIRVLGPSPSPLADQLWNLPSRAIQFGLVVLVLRLEVVRLQDLGLGRRQLGPALVAMAGVMLAVNAILAGSIVLAGGTLTIDPFGLYRSAPYGFTARTLLAGGLAQYLFIGPVEEVAFRGYLQNRVTGLLGRGSARVRSAVAVVVTAAGFAALHIPTLVLVEGAPVGAALGTLVMLTLSGVAFGTIYALTRNLFLVAGLHGIGNLWPLILDPGPGAWPDWGVILVVYGTVVVGYRWWYGDVVRSAGRHAPAG